MKVKGIIIQGKKGRNQSRNVRKQHHKKLREILNLRNYVSVYSKSRVKFLL